MAINKDGLKMFNIRMTKDLWMFLKKQAASQECSMTDIVLRCVEKYKKKFEDKLTRENINV